MDFATQKNQFDAVCTRCAAGFKSFIAPKPGMNLFCKSCRVPMIDFSKSLYLTRFAKAVTAKLGVPAIIVRGDGNTYDVLITESKPRLVAMAKLKGSDPRVATLTALVYWSSKDKRVNDVIVEHQRKYGVEVPFT